MNTIRLLVVLDAQCHCGHNVCGLCEEFRFDIDHKKNFIGCSRCGEIIVTFDWSEASDDIFRTSDHKTIYREIGNKHHLDHSHIDNYVYILVNGIMIDSLFY